MLEINKDLLNLQPNENTIQSTQIEDLMKNFLQEKHERMEEVCRLALRNNEVIVIQDQKSESGQNIYLKTKSSDMPVLCIEISYFTTVAITYKYFPLYYEWKENSKNRMLHKCLICDKIVEKEGMACSIEHAEEWRMKNIKPRPEEQEQDQKKSNSISLFLSAYCPDLVDIYRIQNKGQKQIVHNLDAYNYVLHKVLKDKEENINKLCVYQLHIVKCDLCFKFFMDLAIFHNWSGMASFEFRLGEKCVKKGVKFA